MQGGTSSRYIQHTPGELQRHTRMTSTQRMLERITTVCILLEEVNFDRPATGYIQVCKVLHSKLAAGWDTY